VGYPGGVSATYGYDFADRAASLAVQVGADPPQTVVSSAGYLPSGPLASLAFGNGLAEQRSFDGRYVPARIEVPGLLDAAYTTDGVGNILSIDRDGLVASFAYQDVHYFLAESRGPWPARAWTYDRIGNRITEGSPQFDGDETLSYTYGVNGAGGNTPQLLRIEPAPGVGEGAVDLSYDDAGDQTSWSGTRPEGAGVETVLMSYGDDRRMSRIEKADATEGTDLLYDGRSFLREAHRTLAGSTDFVRTEAVYSTEGVLHLRTRETQSTTGGDSDEGGPGGTTTATETTYLLYFAGRPVAQLIRPVGGTDQLVLLTTDHLGSPMLATDAAGAVLWQGGLAPFGEPYTLGDNAGGEDGDPSGPPGDGDDPNAPPPPPPPPPGGDGREPPPPPPPPDDGRDGPPPPPGGGGGDGGDPDGRDGPPPPPGGGGGDGGDPDGRPDPPPPAPPGDGRDGPPPPPPPPPPPGSGGDPNGRDVVLAPAPGDGKALSLSSAEIFLRYPGQWDDSAWSGYVQGGVYYNVNRWYQPATGRYTRLDPVRWLQHSTHYLYGENRPTFLIDSRGLAPCAGLAMPSPGSCCGEGSKPLAPSFRNILARRALYCAKMDKPPITVAQGEKKGWVEVPEQGPPTAHFEPQGNPCIDWCICDHESFHIAQAMSGELREISHNAAECKAYNRHLRCLTDLTAVGPIVTGAE